MKDFFEKFSRRTTNLAGSHWAFITACIVVLAWAISGPIFHFSDRWQMIINTGTTIITFLMVFILQQSNNKDTKAIHLKLDAIIKGQENVSDEFQNIEEKTEEEFKKLKAGQ